MNTLDLLLAFPHAMVSGLLVALVCALLGVFVVLRRVVFIGVVLSEVAACGIAGAFVLGWPPFLGAAPLTVASVAMLAIPSENRRLPRDAVLGVLFILAASTGILLASGSAFGLSEVKALLYGDLILAGPRDVRLLAAVLLPAAALFLAFQRPLLNACLDRDFAQVTGGRPALWETGFFILLGLVISAASRTAGSLLVFCHMAVSPATALLLTRRLEWTLLVSAATATVATAVGCLLAFRYDMPCNQTICVVSCAMFAAAALARGAARGVERLRR